MCKLKPIDYSRKTITETICELPEDFEEARKLLNDRTKFGTEWLSLFIASDEPFGLCVMGERKETFKEVKARVERVKAYIENAKNNVGYCQTCFEPTYCCEG